MNYRKLGKTDLEVSESSLGCWTLGGKNWQDGISIGWDNVNEDEATEAINYAIEKGVNHFDNADIYGNGRAERMLAKILDSRNNDVIIASKVGWFSGTAKHAYDPMNIRHQCEQSLKNLNRDYIDIYYFHHGDFGNNDEYLDDAINEMYKLRTEGKIRLIGQSAYSNEDFLRLVPKVKPDVLQSSANALDDHYLADDQPVSNLMKDEELSFVAFSPLGQGLLLDKFSKDNPPQFVEGDHRNRNEKFRKEYLAELEPKINKIKNEFGNTTEDLARVAQQFLLHYNSTGCVIPGFRNLGQVKINLSAIDKPLTDDEFKFVKSVFNSKKN